jgi:transcriptional regulator with XRE-family HTH domain
MSFITHTQARAARAILRWSVAQAAEASGLTGNTVNRYEQGRKARMETPFKLRAAYEKSGIKFPDDCTVNFDPSFNAISETDSDSD